MMKLLKIMASAALAMVMTIGLASSAQADDNYYHGHTSDWWPYSGTVDFWAHGDIVKVCDRAADGYGVRVWVTDISKDPDLFKYEIGVGGEGTCKSRQASWGSPYDLREGHKFEFKICLVKTWTHFPEEFSYCNTYRPWTNR